MLVLNPTLARKVIQDGMARQVFPLSEVAKLSAVSVETIRNLINRGNVRLRFTKPEGYGVKVKYAFHDVLEIMAASELLRIGIAPKGFGNIADEISTYTIYQIQEAAGMWGSSPEPANYQRYVVIVYNEHTQEVQTAVTSDPAPEPLNTHITRLVVDCRLLANKALFAYANYKE